MNIKRCIMKRTGIFALSLLVSVLAFANDTTRVAHHSLSHVRKEDDAPITLPQGFKSVVVASNLGKTRHLVVAASGDIFVKLQKLKDGKGILRLHDANGDGKAEDISSFGNYIGSGITIKNGYLY